MTYNEIYKVIKKPFGVEDVSLQLDVNSPILEKAVTFLFSTIYANYENGE